MRARHGEIRVPKVCEKRIFDIAAGGCAAHKIAHISACARPPRVGVGSLCAQALGADPLRRFQARARAPRRDIAGARFSTRVRVRSRVRVRVGVRVRVRVGVR